MEDRLVGVGLRCEVDPSTGNVVVSQILHGGPAFENGQVRRLNFCLAFSISFGRESFLWLCVRYFA
jgi:hypothetical protein